MAPRRSFPSRHRVGSVTSATDASGKDGVGGFAFVAGKPDQVFMMSDEWPADIKLALAADACELQAKLRRASSTRAIPNLPMPTAELFGKWLLPTLLRKEIAFKRVMAIGDCQPAVQVINSLVSGKPMMRAIAEAARAGDLEWRGVHVRRDFNFDCDRLSHPSLWEEVKRDAEGANLNVTRLFTTQAEWQVCRDAIAAGAVGRDGHEQPAAAANAV